MDEYKDEPTGWGARIAVALLAGLFLAVFAYGCASALDYDDFYDYHPVLRNIRRRGLYFLRTTDRPWCRSPVQACSFQGS